MTSYQLLSEFVFCAGVVSGIVVVLLVVIASRA